MTRPSSAPALPVHDVDAALAAMRARGLRVSGARRSVLEALYAAPGPLTAERLADGARHCDPASVYRNLEVLEGIGLVRHFHLGHGAGLYVRADAEEREFLLCEACGEVRALDPAALDGVRALLRRELRHEARFSHFPIAGRCAACAAADAPHAHDAHHAQEAEHAHP